MNKIWRSAAGLSLGTLAIGFAAIWVRLSQVGPLATGFWRLIFASVFVFFWGILFDRESLARTLTKENRQWLGMTACAGLAFGADLALWHIAIHHTTVAMATLFANFAPFFMLIGAVLFLGERLHPKAIGGIVSCALGIGCLSLRYGTSPTGVTWQGNILALGAAFFYAIYLLVLRRVKGVGIKPVYTMGFGSVFGALLFLPLALIWEWDKFWPQTMPGWGLLIFLAASAQVLGQGLITAFLPQVSGELSSAILCLQSVCAAIAGYFILGESMTMAQIIGSLLVIGGIFMVRWAQSRK